MPAGTEILSSMKTTEEMLDEIENANNGDGPDPVATVDDPVLAKIAVALRRPGLW